MMGQCVSKKKNSKNKEENDVSSNSINNKDFDDDQSLWARIVQNENWHRHTSL